MIRDANAHAHALAACFGHPTADPATCKHPIAALHCTIRDEPVLMYGTRRATAEEQPTDTSSWAPTDKRRGKVGEFWYTVMEVATTRCFACGVVTSEGIYRKHLEELPIAVLAERWHLSLEDATRCHRPTKQR